MTSSDTSKEHDFEEWFHQYQEKGRSRSTSTNCDALVQHAYFGSLRGLRMKPTVTTDAAYNTNNPIIDPFYISGTYRTYLRTGTFNAGRPPAAAMAVLAL